jgi:diguanylate cyclase (GGDEF)-like protein
MAMPKRATTEKREEVPEKARRRNASPHRVHRPVNPQETLDSTAHLAGSVFKSDIIGICLADEDGYLTIRSHMGLPQAGAARWRRPSSLGAFGEAFRTRRPCILTDGAHTEELAPGLDLHSGLIVPLCIGKTVIGCLCIGYRSKRRLSKQDVRLAVLFGDYASVVIETAALYEGESRERRRSSALLKIVQAPQSGRSLKDLLTKLSRAVLKLTVAERCVIFVLSEDRRSVEAVLALGGNFPLRWDVSRGPGVNAIVTPDLLVALADRNSKPMVEEHISGPGLVPKKWLERFDIKSLAAFPLAYRRKAVGLMAVYSYSDYASFPKEEVETLAAVAKQAAVLIENARLYEREQRQRERDERVAKLLTAASSTLSLRQVCAKVCEATLDLTVGDNVSIFLIDEDNGGFIPMSSVGGGGQKDTRTFLRPPPDVMFSESYRNGDRMLARLRKPFIAEDARASPFTHKWWTDNFDLKSIVYYPLIVKGRSIGLMTVNAMGEQRKFPQEEIRTLNAVAKQAAVIIENARLYEREQRQRKRSERLAKMLTAASSTLSLSQVCAKVCEAALELTAGDTVTIFLDSKDNNAFKPVSALGRGGLDEMKTFLSPPREVMSNPNLHRFGRMLANRRKPYIIDDATIPPYADTWWVRTFGLKSLAYYPLRTKDRAMGFMSVAAIGQRQKFPQEEIDTLSAVATQAAVIIENARLFEQQQGQKERAEALVNVLTAAASTLSFKKVLAQLCQAVVDISVADRVSVFLMAEDGTHLEPVMSLGADDPELWEKFRNPRPGFESAPESMRLFQTVTTMEEPIVADDAPSSPLLEKWWVETFGIKSIVEYPLRVKDRTIGMMTVDSFRRPVHFPKEEVDTLAAIAKQAGVIIENARVYEREQQQHQRAEALVDVLTTAASTLSLNKVLMKICQTAVDISVADRCSIFVVGEDGRLKPMMSLGVEDPEAWERFRNAQALAGKTAASADLRRFYGAVTKIEDPVIIEDAASSPLIPKWWLDAFQVKSIVHYPLRIKDRTIGLMSVDSFREPVRFPNEEIDTLAAIAKQAAVVIENARLHDQLREQAITDHVTDLFNHRHIFERLDEEFARATRTVSSFAVMMMDVDKFKDFNDSYGHLEGDEALRFIGQKLRETLRASDILGRYGGDEFLAILPDTTRAEAEEAGGRIMATLADQPFTWEDSDQSVAIAMSIGIACYPQDSQNKDELVMLADTALYEAKRLGGRRALPVQVSEVETVSTQSLGFGLLQGLLNAVAHKDPYTMRHCEDNVRYVDQMADQLHLNLDARESLRKAALLHDVGKIAIPDQTLLKPGPLDSDEWEIMQQHVRFGEMIVKGIAQISDAIEPVATHHERFDGKGYPRGLKGDRIPLLGRILAVVDAYSAMTLDRPYRDALPEEEAIAELRKGAGTQFDPAVVEAFLETLPALKKQRKVA